MSEFIKKLERISKEKGQPIGFGAAVKAKGAPMMLVCRLDRAEAETATSAISIGVDALLFAIKDLKGEIDTLSQIAPSIGSIPWGVQFEAADIEEINTLTNIGCDYLVFKTEVPAQILSEGEMGKVIEVEISLDDSLIRSIRQLAIDAVLFNKGDEFPLTVRRLMDYQRVISLAGKPALAFLSPALPASELENLWGVGIRGLIADLSRDSPQEKLSRIKEVIQKLSTPKKRPESRIEPILPITELPSEEIEGEI